MLLNPRQADSVIRFPGIYRRFSLPEPAALNPARERAYLRPSAPPRRPPHLSIGDIRFELAVRGHRLGWVNGTPPDLCQKVVLPLYAHSMCLIVGQAPSRFASAGEAIQSAYQAYVDANADTIRAEVIRRACCYVRGFRPGDSVTERAFRGVA